MIRLAQAEWNAAKDEVVDAHISPARDYVIALIRVFLPRGNVIGIVLQVSGSMARMNSPEA